MALKFQTATEQDINSIVGLLTKLYVELGEEANAIRFLTPDLVKTILNSELTGIMLVKYAGQIVGILTYTESQAIYAGGKYGAIDEMYILPEFRGKSIGEKCIEHLMQIARDKKWKRVVVTAPTDEARKRTVKFYEKCGFSYTGPKLKIGLNDI